MALFLTIYESDSGRALPSGFRTELPAASEVAELEARLTLLGIAMDSLGLEVSFTSEPPRGWTAPEQGFEVVE